MSVKPVQVSQLIQNLRTVLQQVDSKTKEESPLGDSTNKQNYVSWISTAEKTRKAAKQSTPELQKLEQFELALRYRTGHLASEPTVESEPLIQHFKTLSEKFGIPHDFTKTQLRHLCDKYPSFAQKLLEPGHEELADSFFKFCIHSPSQSCHRRRDVTHWVDIFVKYPEITERLMASCLYEKLGMFPENIYILAEEVHITVEGFKDIDLEKNRLFKEKGLWPMPLSVKKEDQQFAFADLISEEPSLGIPLTIEQVFKQFESSSPSDIDVTMKGMINLNSTLLATRRNREVYAIDPKEWTKYRPHVELSWRELKAKYPEAEDGLNCGFVLIAEKNGQTYFEFIRKEKGNYQVFFIRRPQKPGAALDQQKRTFSPLTEAQGEIVKRKVGEDIEHCRKATAEGRPIPSLDVQSYVDEVLGHPFYANIEGLIADLFKDEKTERINELTQARQNLDTAAFEKVIKPLIDKLIRKQDIGPIHQFIKTSLESIYSVLHKDGTKNDIPTKEEVVAAGKALHDSDHNIEKMIPSLVALGSICFEALHPYRMTVAAAEKDTLVLGRIFRIVEAIPWAWLKNLLNNFLLTILGPFRGYHYKTLVQGNQGGLKRLFRAVGNLKPEKYINRPSQLFDGLSTEQKQAIEDRIKNHLTVLAVRGASAGVGSQPPSPPKPPPTLEPPDELFFSTIGEPPKDDSSSSDL